MSLSVASGKIHGFFLLILLGFPACQTSPQPPPPSRTVPQTLYFALDGAPFEVMDQLKREGFFQDFRDPIKVIAPFPSTSVTGFGAILQTLGTQRPLGYDAKYFSLAEGKEVGSLLGTADERSGGYQKYFDLIRSSVLSQLFMYTFPELSGRLDFARAKKILWSRPHQKDFFVYIGTTEAAGHILGRKAMIESLKKFDDSVKNLRSEYQNTFHQELQVVFFSDHGFRFGSLKPVPSKTLEKILNEGGFSLSENLLKKNHVVSISWGNISAGSFYADSPNVPKVAEMVRNLEGSDIVAYREGDKVMVLSSQDGKAEIQYRPDHNLYRYNPVMGDPLHYKGILEGFRRDGKITAEGFAKDGDWFEATQTQHYPDALFRIYQAFFHLVENPAPILFSTKEDYELGDEVTRFLASLVGGYKGTHGGLFREASEAMVMTTDPTFLSPPVIRYNEVMKFFFRKGP